MNNQEPNTETNTNPKTGRTPSCEITVTLTDKYVEMTNEDWLKYDIYCRQMETLGKAPIKIKAGLTPAQKRNLDLARGF